MQCPTRTPLQGLPGCIQGVLTMAHALSWGLSRSCWSLVNHGLDHDLLSAWTLHRSFAPAANDSSLEPVRAPTPGFWRLRRFQ